LGPRQKQGKFARRSVPPSWVGGESEPDNGEKRGEVETSSEVYQGLEIWRGKGRGGSARTVYEESTE